MKCEPDKIIGENPALFSTETLAEGHHRRFLDRLENAEATARRAKKFPAIRLAAAAGLAASIILMVLLLRPDGAAADGRFTEAALWFSAELENTAEQVRARAGYLEPASRSELLVDIEMLSRLHLDAVPPQLEVEERIGILYEQYDARVNSLKMIENSLIQIR